MEMLAMEINMMAKYKAVFLDFIPKELNDIYREYALPDIEYITMESNLTEERIEKAKEADFYIMAGAKVDRAMIDLSPKLKLIHHQGVGFEKTDVAYASQKNIPVCTTPAGTVENVAEHAIMLILACMRQLVVSDQAMRHGKFLAWELRDKSYSLMGKTVGIIGFGRIGKNIAKRLQPFGVKVLVYDKFLNLCPADQKQYGITQSHSLDELVGKSDVISVHMPLTLEDIGFINTQSVFGRMKPTAIFINTARGQLVKEADLVDVLKNKKIAAAGIDVFEDEPVTADNPLMKLDNVIVTPHIAAGTRDAQIARVKFIFRNINNFLDGKPLESCLNADKIRR
jgi:phosphoglycerate dehydrogenase-like enzyme